MIPSNTTDLSQCQPSFQERGGAHTQCTNGIYKERYTTYSRLWNILNFEISQISMIISNTSDLFQCQPSFQERGGVHKMYKWNLQRTDNKILELLKNASTPCHGGQGFTI